MADETDVIEIEATTPSTALVPKLPAVGLELWHPDALRATIQREIALRAVMLEYVRGQMVRGKHYYTRADFRRQGEDEEDRGGGDDKPSLTKEGALNFSHLLHCRPASPEVVETYLPEGHYTVRTRVKLISLRTGEVVGEGEGLCTTLESKYQWRWVPDWKLPEGGRESLVWREVRIRKGTRAGQRMRLYRLPNVNLPDLYNTILKLSFKRGLVAATLTLPLASELFTQDVEDLAEEDEEEYGGGSGGGSGTGGSGQPGGATGSGRPAGAFQVQSTDTVWSTAEVERMASTTVNGALAKRLRYLAPDSKEERNGYIRLAFGDHVRSWADVEPLGLSVRKEGLRKLLAVTKDAPPAEPAAEDDDVPLGDEAEAHLASIRDYAAQPEPQPSPPVLVLRDGYAAPEVLTALRAWAMALGQTDVLEQELARGPSDASGPQVVPGHWDFCTRAVIQAAALTGASRQGTTPADAEDVP